MCTPKLKWNNIKLEEKITKQQTANEEKWVVAPCDVFLLCTVSRRKVEKSWGSTARTLERKAKYTMTDHGERDVWLRHKKELWSSKPEKVRTRKNLDMFSEQMHSGSLLEHHTPLAVKQLWFFMAWTPEHCWDYSMLTWLQHLISAAPSRCQSSVLSRPRGALLDSDQGVKRRLRFTELTVMFMEPVWDALWQLP